MNAKTLLRLVRALLSVALAGMASAGVHAQTFPTKPIRIVVPFPPAGGTDIMSRTVATRLTELNKWTVVVENKPGAGGNIGVSALSTRATTLTPSVPIPEPAR